MFPVPKYVAEFQKQVGRKKMNSCVLTKSKHFKLFHLLPFKEDDLTVSLHIHATITNRNIHLVTTN